MNQTAASSEEHGQSKLRASSLPFSYIPRQSRLFLEYLRDPVSLRRYYPHAVDSYTELPAFISEVLANYTTDRNALCDALTDINSHMGAGERTGGNIALLRDADTVAVVTGQQAGLFTGPLYTIYKALSAVKAAECLNGQGHKAVPVFWTATEDHDFDEVSHTSFIGSGGEVVETTYRPGGYVKDHPVGNVQIDGTIDRAIDETFRKIPVTEFSGEVRASVERAWLDGTFFGSAFAKNLANILGKLGLIFVDPLNPALKSLAGPIYERAIEKSDEIVAGIRRRNHELEADGFHAQVKVDKDYFPLFRHDDRGRRLALRKSRDARYQSKEERREFTVPELRAIARDDPARFSPGVMLRPVVQDFLLPTVCYLGGAAEIAYFAQNSETYRILGRPVTPILHRQSFTVVESKHRRMMERSGLSLPDMFGGVEETLQRIGKRQLPSRIANTFAEAEKRINDELDRLGQELSQIDQTLAANLSTRRRKIEYHIAALKKKAYLAQTRKDATLEGQLLSAFNALLPSGELQERVINVHSFLNKYGSYFIDMIYGAIDLDDKQHRIIDI